MTNATNDFVARALVSRGTWASELKGKTAIVTGAGRLRSIGRPIALELARQGVNVVITGTGRDPASFPPDEKEVGWRDIDSVADEIKQFGGEVLPLVSDVSNPEAVDEMVRRTLDRFGHVDILVNNAGAARGPDRGAVVDMPYDVWSKVIDVNLNGTFLASKAVAKVLIEQGKGGRIVNISSIGAIIADPAISATLAPYASSKAGIEALTHTLAMQLAPHGIRVNAIRPGLIETARMDDLGRGERWEQFVKQIVPLGYPGNGMEIAYMCTFLCSDMGDFITGQSFNVDGGSTWH